MSSALVMIYLLNLILISFFINFFKYFFPNKKNKILLMKCQKFVVFNYLPPANMIKI